MPPSALHMDQVRAKTHLLQQAAAERVSTGEPAKTEASTDAKGATEAKGTDDKGMSFWDVLDVVNPLQHIPGVNKVYQAITGDTIRTPAKIAGAALFFGPVGLALAGADAVLEKETGRDALDHVAHALGIGSDDPGAPTDEDPFTVTAPRLQHAAENAPAPVATAAAVPVAQARQPVDLSAGQAALLESLMGGGGQSLPTNAVSPAPAATSARTATVTSAAASAVTASSITAHAPAAGGIGNAQQLKQLESTPGASAAVTAARGMGPQAIVASLPAPGAAGAGDNLLAAMEQDQQRFKNPNAGKGLAEYRAAAISSGSMQVKPVVASRAAQMVRAAGANMPGAAVPASPVAGTPPSAATGKVPTPVPTTTPTTAAAPVPAGEQPASWPPGGAAPLPKDLIADMMTRAMDKYDAKARTGAPNATGTVH